MFFEKSVGGVVFWQSGGIREYLLLYYPKKKINQSFFKKNNSKNGYWDFPKGHLEDKETEIATLKREIKEETGIGEVFIIDGFQESIEYFFQQGKEVILKKVIFYLVESKLKEVRISPEHTDFVWAQYQKALNLIKFDSTKKILKQAEKFLNLYLPPCQKT